MNNVIMQEYWCIFYVCWPKQWQWPFLQSEVCFLTQAEMHYPHTPQGLRAALWEIESLFIHPPLSKGPAY